MKFPYVMMKKPLFFFTQLDFAHSGWEADGSNEQSRAQG